MPRTARATVGCFCYHVLNRGNGGAEVFHEERDFHAFVRLMRLACARCRCGTKANGGATGSRIAPSSWPAREAALKFWAQFGCDSLRLIGKRTRPERRKVPEELGKSQKIEECPRICRICFPPNLFPMSSGLPKLRPRTLQVANSSLNHHGLQVGLSRGFGVSPH
jgi:hypothetical protein